jgi:hypothetical protein
MSDRQKLINLSNQIKTCLQNDRTRIAIQAQDVDLYQRLRQTVAEVDSMKGWPEVCSAGYCGGMP